MNTDSLRVYDIGTDVRRYDVDSLQAFAWPVAAWTCVVPDTIDPNGLNIFVKLILSLVDKGVFTERSAIASFLKNELEVNPELVENVLEDCETQYFNKNFKKNIRLKEDAIKMLRSSEGDISFIDNVGTTSHKIYLLQDCVTKAVVPCFDLKQLPKEYEAIADTSDYIKPNCEISVIRQPKTSSINNALKLWARILRNVVEDEVIVASIETSDHLNEKVESLALTDEMEMDDSENITSITILSDKPEYMYVRGYLRFDFDYPEELLVHSPFGVEYDTWFEKILRRVLITDIELKNQFDYLIQLKKEYFKDKMVFGSDREIGLYNQFPSFFNNEKHIAIKDAVRNLYMSFDEYKHGCGRDDMFKSCLRVAIDKYVKIIKDENPDLISQTYVNDCQDLKSEINALCSIVGVVPDKGIYISDKLMKNYTRNIRNDEGNAKDILARMLVYAYRYQDSKIFDFFAREHKLFKMIEVFAGFGNKALHSNIQEKELEPNMVSLFFNKYLYFFEQLYKCFY